MKGAERRAVFRHKFKSYKTGFYIFFAIYFLSFILGIWLFKKETLPFLKPLSSLIISCYDRGFHDAFRILLLSLIPSFFIFSSGVTLYSPLISGMSVLLFAASSGAGVSFFISEGRIALGMFEIIFSSLIGYATIIYATLCTLTCLRIFTDTDVDDGAIFTGTLFRAERFRGIFNLRYALTYILFYILFSFITVLITALRALAVSLV